MSVINFESLLEIQNNRKLERETRQRILDKAKLKYEGELRRKQEAKERGETTWMLPAIEDKINSQDKKKKKKKEKKEKKSKKEKKAKKEKKLKKEKKSKKKVSSESSASSSESEDDNASANCWVEKPSAKLETEPPKREEWMELTSLFKTRTREQMRIADGSSRALKKLEERKRKEEVNKPGSHCRELNPYYRDGGIGLPSAPPPGIPHEPPPKSPSFDASWLRRALRRAKDQAEAEGRPLEEVAAERWGSLETFYKLLEEAEGKTKPEEDRTGGSREIKSRRSRSRSSDRRRKSGRSKSRSSDRRRKSGRSRSRERNNTGAEKNKSGSGSPSRERSRAIRKSRSRSVSKERIRRGGSGSKQRCRKSRSRSGDRKGTRRSRERRSSSSSSSSSSRERSSPTRRREYENKNRNPPPSNRSGKLTMLRPGSDDEASSAAPASMFLKPGHSSTLESKSRAPSSVSNKSGSCSWRKKFESSSDVKGHTPPPESSSSSESTTSDSAEDEPKKLAEGQRQQQLGENKSEEEEIQKPAEAGPLLTDKEMNQLAAKLTKAELMGNEALTAKLSAKLAAARGARERRAETGIEGGGERGEHQEADQVVVLTRTDRTGFTRPIAASACDEGGGEGGGRGKTRKKKRKVETFDADGQRVSYYADDFKVDLQSMFEKEKTTSAADQIAALERLSCQHAEKLSDDYDVDDMFVAKVAPGESGAREAERDRRQAIWEHQRMQKTLDDCHFCVGNKLMKKHLIVALGTKCYMSVPHHVSLTEGHCLIAPLHHVPCSTRADEDLWQEIMEFRQALVRMFSADGEDCIFFEVATRLQQTPHMVLHCVPLPKETGELAPIYFKKAIMECDEEWAQNKKLIELKGRSVRRAVPKGLPYFFVDFGLTPGFAHVVENERIFPDNFAQEIIGGMIDADFSLYRKPKAENFDTQRKKVLKFAEMFKPFDPTQ